MNAAARISASWSAEETLAILHDIEADLGRTRNTRWGQRTLDLDLIAYGDAVLPDPQTHAYWRNLPPDEQNRIAPQELVLPHPRLQDRAFVLVPLADVASDWVHPLLGQSVRALCAALDPADVEAVRRLQ